VSAGSVLTRALGAAPRLLTALALAAAALALLVPSRTLASHSDLLLAALVAATALGISRADLARLRGHRISVAVLALLPWPLLAGGAWLLSRPFSHAVRDGLLAVGVSSTEVAAVALVSLAGADATLALGALAGSLVVAALAGPLAIGLLAPGAAHAGSAHLLGRFALVVILPLALGVAARSEPRLGRRLAAADSEREGVAALLVAVLVYAALSGANGAHHLGGALLASAAFLALSAGLAYAWSRFAPRAVAVPGALCIAMRDFAVGAAIATQAFGPGAGTVAGFYGVLMLLGGAIAANALRRRAPGRP
jgi:predicted Na+-dependent transporter